MTSIPDPIAQDEPTGDEPDATTADRGPLRRWAPGLVVLAAVALMIGMAIWSPFETQGPDVTVQGAYVGAGADPAGGYLVLVNDGGGDDLVGVSVPGATVTLQRQVVDATTGQSSLVEAPSLRLPGYEEVRLQPGGDQLLLSGLTPVAGTSLPMELRFRRSPPITVEATVLTYDEIGTLLLPPRLEEPANS
jgi:copper(I)-binding protein